MGETRSNVQAPQLARLIAVTSGDACGSAAVRRGGRTYHAQRTGVQIRLDGGSGRRVTGQHRPLTLRRSVNTGPRRRRPR